MSISLAEMASLSEKQQATYHGLLAATEIRQALYKTVYVDRWPKLFDMQETVMLGSFSWLGMSTKTRWLYRPTSVVIGDKLATPGDIARDYISLKYPKRLRATTKQYRLVMEKRHHPLFAEPSSHEESLYIDLRKAYWTILQAVGYDVDYCPGKWLAAGQTMEDFPFYGDKLVRNCLVSAGMLAGKRIWKADEKKLIVTKENSSRPNMVLWALVQDVLNGIAYDAVNAGAFYVHTDGYITPAPMAYAVIEAIEAWGFPWGVKHNGKSVIYGPGCYDIGEHRHKQKVVRSTAVNAIRVPDRIDWLRQSFRKHMERV